MKSIFLAALIALFATPALACQFNTDCGIGSKCIKEAGKREGICMGGMNPGNSNDRNPYSNPMRPDSSVGNTCQYNSDCNVREKCVKERGLNGVCVPK
jgi:predicted small secreted protein